MRPRAVADRRPDQRRADQLIGKCCRSGPARRSGDGLDRGRGERFAVEVHDSGPGLSAQARSTLFEPSISFKKGGMGLGLSIARRSALLCGGDWQTAGRGTGRRGVPPQPERRRGWDWKCDSEWSRSRRQWHRGVPCPGDLVKRVLIVDDEENIGRSLRLILEREGYAVSACSSVGEAKAFSQRPDVYLIDVRLPDGSGIDLVRWLRANDVAAPALMISGHGTIAEAVEATRAGAFDFLEKPLSRDKVLLSLKHALENSKLRDENQRLREIAGAAAHDRVEPGFREGPGTGHAGRAHRCARAADRRIGHRQGIAGRAHPRRESLRRAARSSR